MTSWISKGPLLFWYFQKEQTKKMWILSKFFVRAVCIVKCDEKTSHTFWVILKKLNTECVKKIFYNYKCDKNYQKSAVATKF